MILLPRRSTSAIVAAFSFASVLLLATLGLFATAAVFGAETSRPAVGTPAPSFQPARPYWLELTPPQRQALAPLTADWERLDGQTKKKWVEIANRYPKMKPEEQTRTQERMREWALLTPEQRRVARDSFERVRSMPPEQRADMLRRYRELPPERREALAHQGTAGKALLMPKTAVANEATTPRRLQIREGTTVRNPVVAAQRSASPVLVPAHAVPPQPVAPAAPPVAMPATATPAPAPASPLPAS